MIQARASDCDQPVIGIKAPRQFRRNVCDRRSMIGHAIIIASNSRSAIKGPDVYNLYPSLFETIISCIVVRSDYLTGFGVN